MVVDVYDAAHEIATFVSLATTVPTVLFAFAVVYFFRANARKAFFATERREVDWLILGIVIGFIGSLVDNAYWGVCWTGDFFGLALTESCFKNGVFPNVFFRQATTLVAALCHLQAAVISHSRAFKRMMFAGWVGVIVSAVLMVVFK